MAKKKEPELRTVFRTNLRNRRKELGVLQRELGDEMGMTQQFIQQLESPKCDNTPNFGQLEAMAGVLKCAPHDLITPGRFGKAIDPDEDLRHYRGK